MNLAKIVQVYPTKDYIVYLYFLDGTVRKFDASQLVTQGEFQRLQNIETFVETCTVMNHTLAWDLTKNRDPYNCLDLDAQQLFNTCEIVPDPLAKEIKP